MSKILFIVGSLRQGSFNHQLALQAEKALAGKAEVTYLDFSQVPVFSQDLESPVLPAVQAVRDAVTEADAIWIFSPIYNQAIPGSVKNLLDWLSRAVDLTDTTGASVLQDKIVTVSSIGNSGQEQVIAAYQALLTFIRTQIVGDFTFTKVNPEAWGTGEIVLTDDAKSQLQAQADSLLAAIG